MKVFGATIHSMKTSIINHSLRTLGGLLLAVVAMCALAYYLFQPATVHAQTVPLPATITGYAWSSNIGWISFNCLNRTASNPNGICASEGGIDYGVTVDAAGNLNGHAWSSNIGWIQFGGLSGFPSASGNAGGNARLTSSNELQGWARVCTVFQTGCSGALKPNAERGGWDGWISLRGNNHTVEFTGGSVAAGPTNHYAWGSAIVGWIDFNPGFNPITILPNPSINSFTATPDEVELGTDVTLNWNVQGMDSCTATNNRGATDWTGNVNAADSITHAQTVTPPEGDTVYTLACESTLTGATFTESVTVTARPDIEINSLSCTNCSGPSLPAPESDGTYDNITFLANITGIPGGNTAPYELSFGGQTVTGTVSGGNETISLNDVVFGVHDATLEVDLPASGTILEDRTNTPAVNEDVAGNSWTTSDILVPPPAPNIMNMSRVDELVRYGGATDLDITVEALYIANCELQGNGSSLSFTTAPSVTSNETFTTPHLTSTSVYELVCTEPITGVSFTEETRIEVIPEAEEI